MDAMMAIRKEFPEARVILVSTFEDEIDTQSALESGAWGLILKTMHPREIVDAIRRVCSGRPSVLPSGAAHSAQHLGKNGLTSMRVEVLAQVAGANSNHDIAKQLLISEDKVKNSLKQIMRKLDTRNHTNASSIAACRGFIRF
jgi:DNA-binding NarL/FixJ family response regulator